MHSTQTSTNGTNKARAGGSTHSSAPKMRLTPTKTHVDKETKCKTTTQDSQSNDKLAILNTLALHRTLKAQTHCPAILI